MTMMFNTDSRNLEAKFPFLVELKEKFFSTEKLITLP